MVPMLGIFSKIEGGRLLEEVWNQNFPYSRNLKLFSKEISLRSNVKGRIIDPPEV